MNTHVIRHAIPSEYMWTAETLQDLTEHLIEQLTAVLNRSHPQLIIKGERYYTYDELAWLLGVTTKRVIHRLVREHNLHPVRLHNTRLLSESEIHKALVPVTDEEQSAESVSQPAAQPNGGVITYF